MELTQFDLNCRSPVSSLLTVFNCPRQGFDGGQCAFGHVQVQPFDHASIDPHDSAIPVFGLIEGGDNAARRLDLGDRRSKGGVGGRDLGRMYQRLAIEAEPR